VSLTHAYQATKHICTYTEYKNNDDLTSHYNHFSLSSIAVGMFGAIMSYIIIIGSLSESILLSFMEPHWYTSSSIWSIFLVGTFVFPMCCIRHFGHLAYVSYASIVTIGLTMLLVLVVGLLSLESNKSEHLNYGSLSGTMDMIGTVIFAFNFSSAIFHAYEALQKEDRNIQTFSSVAKWTTFSGVVLSFMFGFIGYLSFREGTYVRSIYHNF
jgi:amino acid permease